MLFFPCSCILVTNPPPPPILAIQTYTSTRSVFTVELHHYISLRNILPNWERGLGQKVPLLLVTVIMPELVVGWAWKERMAARRIQRQISEKGRHRHPPFLSLQPLEKISGYKISMAHAHLIEMGGLALCLPEEKVREALVGNEDTLENKNNLTEPGLISAVDDELPIVGDGRLTFICQISKCEHQDRTKTDGLAKFITAMQVLWSVIGAMGWPLLNSSSRRLLWRAAYIVARQAAECSPGACEPLGELWGMGRDVQVKEKRVGSTETDERSGETEERNREENDKGTLGGMASLPIYGGWPDRI